MIPNPEKRLLRHASLALLLAAAGARAADLDLFTPYRPAAEVSGKLVAWGNPEQVPIWTQWCDGFRKFQPKVRFEANMKSSATIAGALFTGTANLGVGGRELMPVEALAYRNIFNRDVFRLTSSSGTFDMAQSTPALAVFVPVSNPLSQLTLTQVDAIFGDEHKRGAPGNIREWGQLGLTGEWAGKRIHVYGHAVGMPANALFFSIQVFNGGTRWNRDLQEFGDLKPDGNKTPGGGAQIIQAISGDPYGIGYTSFDNKTPGVKSLALAPTDGAAAIAGSRDTVADRTYPLTRNTYLYANRDPATGLEPVVREFMRYVLSREGQRVLIDNGYLPLTAAEDETQRKRIE